MDLQMPHMDGLQAARTIRLHAGAAGEVPIIAMTANAYADDISAARESGMNDFVSKPIRKRLLVEALNRVLAARPEDSLLVTPVAKAWPTENPAALLDLSAYARLVDEIDAETAQELFEAFTAETKRILPRLRVQAQEGDVLAVRREAHALKSTAGTFGLVEVARQAQALETSALDLPQPDLLDHLTRLQDTLLRSLAEFHAHESQDRGIQVEV
jgi:DNA-binding response OmpR family regulator